MSTFDIHFDQNFFDTELENSYLNDSVEAILIAPEFENNSPNDPVATILFATHLENNSPNDPPVNSNQTSEEKYPGIAITFNDLI